MHYELSDVKRMRKQHGLTQSELAKLTGISQSLIAKTEAGMLEPGYTKVKKIFEVLEGLEGEKEIRAKDVMSRKIIKVTKTQTVKDAIEKMKEHGISQLPVTKGDAVIGMVSESEIINRVFQGKDAAKLTVKDVMQEAPPIVSGKTPLRLVMNLLRFSSLVLVGDNGKITGVITKADVIKNLSMS